MADWIPIRIKTEPNKIKHVQAELNNFKDGPLIKYMFQQMQSLAASAADVGRNYMKYNPAVFTRTGEERAARGAGIPGRSDSGDMIAKFTWSGRKVSNGKYQFKVGWVSGTPGYAIFQELGTKRGVQAMNALGFTTEFLRRELKLMEYSKSMKVRNAAPWDGEDS